MRLPAGAGRLRPNVVTPSSWRRPLEAVLAGRIERGERDAGFHGAHYRPAVLFRLAQLDGIAAGEIDLAVPPLGPAAGRAGGTQRTAVGVIGIDDVRRGRRITRAEARRAGFATPDEAVRALRPDGDLYRIALHLEGPDPRVALRETIRDDLAELRARSSGCRGARVPAGDRRATRRSRAEELAAVVRRREARLQAARAAAQGARADDLAEPRLPPLAARRGVP